MTIPTDGNEDLNGPIPSELGLLTLLEDLELCKFFVVGANGVVAVS